MSLKKGQRRLIMAEDRMEDKKIEGLKEYLRNEPNVILGFLFGSQTKDSVMDESDFDLALYLKDERVEDEIYSNLIEILGGNIDLVLLNEVPASLSSNVLRTGIPLVIKDKGLYLDLYLKVSSEALDFLEFAEDYFRIYRSSKSLSPEEKIRLLERVQFLDSELGEIEDFRGLSFNEYCHDKSKRRNIERWTENILNATIDIAKIVLAGQKRRMPHSYEEALLYFALSVGFNEEDSKVFSRFAGLRNILAHEYLGGLYKKIQDFISGAPIFYKETRRSLIF